MAVLTIEEYKKLGADDSVAQEQYHEVRRATLSRLWKCTRCEKRLPRTGREWLWRFKKFVGGEAFFQADVASCGYFCDSCAEARESGMDFDPIDQGDNLGASPD